MKESEPEVQNIRSPKSDRLEIREPERYFSGTRKANAVLCVICAALIMYIYFDKCDMPVEAKFIVVFVLAMLYLSAFFYWSTQQIIGFYAERVKRKATDKVSD